jgi:predicted TIM-barrel fold metal-dependent hydrolase
LPETVPKKSSDGGGAEFAAPSTRQCLVGSAGLRSAALRGTVSGSGGAGREREGWTMKEGYRFVDCDMHIMEPMDLFDKYLDPAFKSRVTSSVRRQDGGSTGMRGRPLWFFDGQPTSNDGNTSQYNRTRGPLVSKRANTTVNFAVERGYDAEAQVIGMAMEGIDIAVLFPTIGLSFLARDDMDPQFSAAICRAYNDWLYGFTRHSPDQLKMAAMLPVHDVNLACQELQRCVKDMGAVGAFVRPNYVNGRYWHSNYWDPLYGMLQDLNVPLCFHEGTGSYYSTIEPRFGENRFMRHVASHSTEMQLALIALMLGGIFEFYPRLKVAFLEAQSWWVPGLLGRIEWDLRQHHDSDAPYLKLSPLEYWQRNCFSAIESGEKEVGSVVELLGGADNMCVSSDFPHFDSSFPEVSNRVLTNPSIDREIAGKILSGGARLYGFAEADFAKAAAAAKRHDNIAGRA